MLTCADHLRLQAPQTGRFVKEDGTCVNIADILYSFGGGGGSVLDAVASLYSTSNGITLRTTDTVGLPVISIRPKAAFSGLNRKTIPLDIGLFAGQNAYYEIIVNGTLTAPTWVDVGGTSTLERDISATAVTGGKVIESGYIVTNGVSDTIGTQSLIGRIELGYAPVTLIADILTIKIVAFADEIPVAGSIQWREIA